MGGAMLTPLYDLTQQFQNKNGSILVAGKLFVYYIGRPDLATTWADDGASAVNPNPILLDNNGRAPCFVDDSYSYTLVVCDRNGQELFSQDITPGGAGSVGGRVVYHDETLTGAGTVASLLGVANIPLGVDETMTAYTGVVDNKDALILGVNGDWFTDTFGSALNDKVDWSSFSACCSAVKGGLDNKVDLSALDNYYTKYEVNSALSNKVDVNYFIDYTSAMEDRLEHSLVFGYDENSAISSINYSALAGSQGELVPWISGTKHIAETQLMTDNMLIQVLSSFDLSGNKNHCINVKGGMYRFPNQWEIASSVQNTNWFMEKSAMSGYFPTSSFNTFIENGFNPNINALYSSASNLTYSANWLINNKLDISAFSSWSANLDLSGDYIPTSASGSFYPMTGNPSGFLTQHQDLSDYATTSVVNNISSYLSGEIDNKLDKSESGNYYPMTGNPSGFLTTHQDLSDYYKKTETSSKEELSAMFATISADETYTLVPGYNIGISSDDNLKQTTIYYTGTNGDEEVNAVVRQYSANGTWLTESDSAKFYPMTGNPSGFLTQHQSLTNYYTKTDTSSKQEISAALQYISSNAGKTYTGVDPIQVNNTTNEISITGEALSAGPNIDIFASGGYVVISANGGNAFPITGTDGTTNYTANANFSSFTLTTGQGPAGAHVNMNVKGVHFEAYPSVDVSASWYNIITQQDKITCSSVKLTTAASENWFYTSALPNLNKITFIAPSYGPYETYSALIDDGSTTFVAEVDSGCCRTVVRNWNDDRNKDCWCGLNQESYFYIG